ncbi:hypothetical protein F5Y19DRAFT_447632 [Xylariaceae sp. FL1651]|nr:hypothetical protein F5Y19DRAFT_447632 [Xylariaceae sp. FL1651]
MIHHYQSIIMLSHRLLRHFCTVTWIFFSSRGLAIPPAANTLWQVSPPLDYSDRLYAGWEQVPVAKETEIYIGVVEERTYAHHPQLYANGSAALLLFSSAPIDEDSMGQDVRISASSDGGLTWSANSIIMPAALLPNQTIVRNFTWYCDQGITQRAWQAHTFVELPTRELYAIGLSASRYCVGGSGGFQSAGRIARQIDINGTPLADPCWIEMNSYTTQQLFSQTVYGTQYGMTMCAQTAQINSMLLAPDTAPFGSPWLANTAFYAADNVHSMGELTHATWFNDNSSSTGGYWQRFWRDTSSSSINTHAVWVEYNQDIAGAGWYPRVLQTQGNQIVQTNIPDAGSKQYMGTFSQTGDRYLVSNPRYNATVLERQPLTIALSRGTNQAYTSVGVLRTNASNRIVPDSRNGLKNHSHGFSYPTAVQAGMNLLVSYSENKENIRLSVVRINDLLAFFEGR